jgi:hypothetical protein
MGLGPYATASLAKDMEAARPCHVCAWCLFPLHVSASRTNLLKVIVFLMFFVALGGAGRHALLFDVFHILQAPSSFSPSPSHHILWTGKGGIEKLVTMLADYGDKRRYRHHDHGSPTLIPNNSKFQGCAIRWHGSARKDVGACFIGHAAHLMSCSPVYHTSLPGFCQILNF